ncbi:MAG TPA: hypothetical protein VFT46_05825, partial [Holophagaceae bacterium]|nr:hypothetical protein [Holophagaceae bacterium]
MATRTRMTLTPLSALIVAAPLCAAGGLKPAAPASLAQIRSQESLRVAQSQAQLLGLRAQLGLDADAGFAPVRALTDQFGQTHARFTQTYR